MFVLLALVLFIQSNGPVAASTKPASSTISDDSGKNSRFEKLCSHFILFRRGPEMSHDHATVSWRVSRK